MLRLQGSEAFWTLQTRIPAGWQDIYRFTLEPQFPIDYEVANWFTSTHPASRFRNNLIVEQLSPACRISLFNTRLTRRHADGRTEEAVLGSPEDLARVLEGELGLSLPADPASVFARLPRG